MPGELTSFPSASWLVLFWGCEWAPSGLLSGGWSFPVLLLGCALSSPACSRYWKPERGVRIAQDQAGLFPQHAPTTPCLLHPLSCPFSKELLSRKAIILCLICHQINDSNFLYFIAYIFFKISDYSNSPSFSSPQTFQAAMEKYEKTATPN